MNAHFLKKNDCLIFKYYADKLEFKVSMYDGQTDGQNPTSFYVRPESSHSDPDDGRFYVRRDLSEPENKDHPDSDDAKEPDDHSDSDGNSQQSARKKACDDKREPVQRGVPGKHGHGCPPKPKEAKEPDDHLDSDDNNQPSTRKKATKAYDDKREPVRRGKRGGGRPPKPKEAKEPDDHSDSDDNNQQSTRKKATEAPHDKRETGAPGKRGRGRPPKVKEAKELDDDHSDSDDNNQQSARKKSRSACDGKRSPVGRGSKTMNDRNPTLEKANVMKRDGETVLYMSPSCIDQPGYGVSCPRVWAKDHGLDRKQEVELHYKGKPWRVNFYLDPEEQRDQLRGGWKEFVSENRIKVGDACILGSSGRRRARGRICIDVRIVKGVSGSKDLKSC